MAEGGRPEPEIDLFAGGRNVSEEGSWTTCRGSGRNSFCVQYDLDITADMSGDTIRSDKQQLQNVTTRDATATLDLDFVDLTLS